MTVSATSPATTPAAKAPAAKAAAKPAAKAAPRRASAKNQGAALPEDHTPAQAIAHAIITLHLDLAPSVNRIMDAEIEEEARLVAITLFHNSLDVPGDPYRFPLAAIEAGRQMAPGSGTE
ncbi:unannotated protein [freshwater metagenome]|uniref:Unannotated protein n=1 Tax=freshwater metagenome TaxID=449393 RepID=A0A6J7EIA3_9ZZZZ|nr:hypothetical protein [Actinomycetota bacterium]